MRFTWKPEKNEELKSEPGRPCFEDVVLAIAEGGLIDIIPNPTHADREILVVRVNGYVHAVPFKTLPDHYFLFTAFPSRKLNDYYGG